jgi:hypothetical protein
LDSGKSATFDSWCLFSISRLLQANKNCCERLTADALRNLHVTVFSMVQEQRLKQTAKGLADAEISLLWKKKLRLR